jgi:hypothetical protein
MPVRFPDDFDGKQITYLFAGASFTNRHLWGMPGLIGMPLLM